MTPIKNIFVLLCLLFLSTNIHAQIEWEELPVHDLEQLSVIYMTEDERLIGHHEYGAALFTSDDLGNSWNLLVQDDALRDVHFSFRPKITENNEGSLFIILGDLIYEIDESSQSLEPFFEPDLFFSPSDFFFLDNNQIIVANIDNIQRYTATGDLIRTVEIEDGSFNTILVKGPNDIHYSYSSRGLIRFNVGLTQVEENIASGSFSTSSQVAIDAAGNLYSTSVFSTDQGSTWQSYPNGIGGIPTVTNADNLHILGTGYSGHASTYVSTDGAISFETFSKDFEPIFSAKPFTFGTDGVAVAQDLCPNELRISENGKDNWMDKSNQLMNGSPNAFLVEAASKDLVLTENCNDWIKTTEGQWENFELSSINSSCRFFSRVFSFPDGSLFSDEGCRSTDAGETWMEFENGFVRIENEIQINAQGIYFLDFGELWKSADNGETWESIPFNPPNVFVSPLDLSIISASESVYVVDFNGNAVRIDFDGEIRDVIAPLNPSTFINWMVASYSKAKVYMLLQSFNSVPELMIYDESNNSRVLKDLPLVNDILFSQLHVDQAENIYFLTDKALFISPDEGDTWQDITPSRPDLRQLTDIDISWDGYLYLATLGTPILKSTTKVVDGFSTLNVVTYLDDNNDCSFQDNETLMFGLPVQVGDRLVNTNRQGEAKIISFQDVIEVNIGARTDLYEVCDFESVVQVDIGDIDTIYVGVQVIDECADLGISGTTPFLRRCFPNTYHLSIFNDGSVSSTDGLLTLELDEFFEYESCSFPLVSQSGSTYVFEVGAIGPRESLFGSLNFTLSCAAELGQTHYLTGSVVSGNECSDTLGDKETFECRANQGSYDPNDKSIYIDGIADRDVIGEDSEIEYLIRFQNTGTDTAFIVRIEDQLSEDFNISSFRPVAGSHDYVWTLDENRTLVVVFDNIMLPDSTVNEEASHGFIRMRAALNRERPEPGDIVENTAAIFFDFNEPIITNTVASSYLCRHSSGTVQATICAGESYEGYTETGTYEDLLQTELGCDSMRTLNLTVRELNDPACLTSTNDILSSQMEVYPVPATDLLYVKYIGSGELASYSMIDLSGRTLKQGNENDSFSIVLDEMTSGIYLLRLTLADGRSLSRRIVVHR